MTRILSTLALSVLLVTGNAQPAAAAESTLKAYVTGYSFYDNTPPASAEISHPVLHRKAGGTGTYTDPITVAVGHSVINGRDVLDWPKGTRFYIPALRRYFIVEDTCGDGRRPQNGPCHKGYPRSASTWLDVWVGGRSVSARTADRCMDKITQVTSVIVRPAKGLPVTAGDIARKGC